MYLPLVSSDSALIVMFCSCGSRPFRVSSFLVAVQVSHLCSIFHLYTRLYLVPLHKTLKPPMLYRCRRPRSRRCPLLYVVPSPPIPFIPISHMTTYLLVMFVIAYRYSYFFVVCRYSRSQSYLFSVLTRYTVPSSIVTPYLRLSLHTMPLSSGALN